MDGEPPQPSTAPPHSPGGTDTLMTDEKPQSHLDVVSTAVDHIEAAAGKANTAQSSNGVASAHPEDDAANAITTPIESPLSEESCDTPVKESDNDGK